ncbi:MAG: hypothetical protein II829_03145 [Bacteroidales bacterium]|nr:hypothetical protein [Bacteroidales bacterium]MBQ4398566.1 hypothetical protein [Bacteroidales bacterium]
MRKIVTEETIKQACSERIASIRVEEEEQLKSVEQQTQQLEEQFDETIDKAGFSSNAFMPSGKLDFMKDSRSLPDGLFVGMLKHPVTGESFIPAILPFASANATGFRIDSSCENQVAELMQTLAFRILLSIPVELVKCHFIDLHSFGQSTKLFNRLAEKAEKITKGALISDKNGLASFVSEMESHVNRLNRNELLDAASLLEYNADPSHIAVPYHFVFFTRIHDKVEKDIISRIYSLCSGRNASTCGIYFFYTYEVDHQTTQQQNDPLSDLLSISTLVTKEANGFRFSNTIYGKAFEERYVFEPEKRTPSTLNLIIDAIAKKAANIKPPIVSFDQDLEKMMANGEYWKGSTIDGITIPIGRKGANGLVNFNLAGKTADYFAMIGGRPGYGKTVLLHDIICNGAIIYPPQELEFYLIDCTNGTGFKPYEHLPHARFISITKQREYTDSAIEYLVNEMYHRAELFKDAGDQTGEAIEKIEKYRTATGKVLPRILVIIDEFQVLLEKNDKLSRKIKGSLEKIIREGRKYGISIVFCTQSYRNIDFDTELITLRIAFNLKEMDSLKVLGSGNDSAAHLTKKGEAILNNSNGEKGANVLFQAAYTEKVQHYVSFCVDKWNELDVEKPKRFVFDGKAVSNIANNVEFVDSLTTPMLNPNHIVTWIGVPMFIRDKHSYATFRKAIGSNMLICGTDMTAALSTIALVNYQISQSIEDIESSLFITDYFSESPQYLVKFAEMAGIPYLPKRGLESVIDSIESLLKKRIDDAMAGVENDNTPIIGTIAYIQNAPDMKKNQFNQPSKLMLKIQDILKNGPDYGIHLIVYAYSYKGLIDVMDNAFVSAFGNRVILQGGAIGLQMAQEADAMAEGTAFLATEDASTTYEQDPVMIYNECRSDALQDDVLDYIFSIYKQE